jgi:TnpA family transposase
VLFHSKVIAANASEAAHVLDGLLDHESELVIREHATDTADAVDHVFGLCHLLGFRFASRIRDLNERRLHSLSSLDPWPTLRPLIAGPVNVRAIEAHWDETLRLAASIRAATVSASIMLRKLVGFPRQNPVARSLRGNGIDVPDELLAHVAPLGWEHVGLTGDYLWGEIDKPRERFRPASSHRSPF